MQGSRLWGSAPRRREVCKAAIPSGSVNLLFLHVATGGLSTPLRGVIVGESDDAVRFRIGDGWDVDIYKNMVLAVREPNEVNIV